MSIFFSALLACTGKSTPDPQDSAIQDSAAPEPTYCELLELPEQEFNAVGELARYGSIAGDFTLQTLDGPWTLSEHWTGCDGYLFFNHHPDYEYPVGVWRTGF